MLSQQRSERDENLIFLKLFPPYSQMIQRCECCRQSSAIESQKKKKKRVIGEFCCMETTLAFFSKGCQGFEHNANGYLQQAVASTSIIQLTCSTNYSDYAERCGKHSPQENRRTTQRMFSKHHLPVFCTVSKTDFRDTSYFHFNYFPHL